MTGHIFVGMFEVSVLKLSPKLLQAYGLAVGYTACISNFIKLKVEIKKNELMSHSFRPQG